MSGCHDQILTAAQMRIAEQGLIAAGTSVDALMLRAGKGAANYVWRLAGGRPVTVLCGPGNNGGDGYVIAETLRSRGCAVTVIAPAEPATAAACTARTTFAGTVLAPEAAANGHVVVDCLFGTGLTRPLSGEHLALLARLAAVHELCVAVDLPSGVDSDTGVSLNSGLPVYDLTIALGAWKPAHYLMPACAAMGALRLVDIGIGGVHGCARLLGQPALQAPPADAHKYRRGLIGVIGGAMPGAALLAARAAQHGGAGYVKLLCRADGTPADLVIDDRELAVVLNDARFAALLIGPGLGRDKPARDRLSKALRANRPMVLDADGLMVLEPAALAEHGSDRIVTPHDGEFTTLEKAFRLSGAGSKVDRAVDLAAGTGSVVVAKGADTVIADGTGRVSIAPRASSWLSTAGTGDVLAGTIASRLASGADPFDAACQGVWLHGEAARLCLPAFTAGQLAEAIQDAYAACL
ncbi:NAD(P)H-hydrate dehydratase [Novosphingobium aquiterrae]|uniref:Bifunctional NAD(P)H-hydrate repair enzyme n=1 Tax=Novosphingobium aquiterrae TaxID=624388 RepID=A0ABV6PE38_9SPHN